MMLSELVRAGFHEHREGPMSNRLESPAVLHVRFDGRSLDIPLYELDARPDANPVDLRRAVARRLDVAETSLDDHVLDRHATGNLTLRPEAVFG